ncbi:MAG: inositol monophosphatase [Polyangiaceae bacterium]|nr:inositol monophosphatase [Polyangiaceae bacterium]
MYEAEVDAARAAAERAGGVLLGYFRKLDPGTVTEKSPNDLVSDADRAAEAVLRAELGSRFPQHGFLGEETGASGHGARRWVVDPLDGTLNFVRGFPHWCVSVALCEGERAIVGCVLDPLRGDCFVAARGGGATWNGKPMAVSRKDRLDGAFLATGFTFQLGDRWPRLRDALDRVFPRALGIRRPGSAALDLAHVACGIFDGYFELGLRPWDVAAGALLVEEAGGRVTDWEGKDAWTETGDVVAGNPAVQGELLRLLSA